MSGFDQVAKGVYSISRHPGNGNDEASEEAGLRPGDAVRRIDKGFEHAPTIACFVVHRINRRVKAYRDLELSGLIVSVRGRGMFVQKNVITDNEELEAADALFVNCLRQYRACGMSYGNIRDHLVEIVDRSESEAKAAEEERQQYGAV